MIGPVTVVLLLWWSAWHIVKCPSINFVLCIMLCILLQRKQIKHTLAMDHWLVDIFVLCKYFYVNLCLIVLFFHKILVIVNNSHMTIYIAPQHISHSKASEQRLLLISCYIVVWYYTQLHKLMLGIFETSNIHPPTSPKLLNNEVVFSQFLKVAGVCGVQMSGGKLFHAVGLLHGMPVCSVNTLYIKWWFTTHAHLHSGHFPGAHCKSKTDVVNMYSVSTGPVQIATTSNQVLTSTKHGCLQMKQLCLAY